MQPITTWAYYSLSDQTLRSFKLSSPRKYWNFFSTPILKGFRKEFAILRDFSTSFYFNKASKFLLTVASQTRTRMIIFGVPILSTSNGKPDISIFSYFNLFVRLYNIIVVGFKWLGGALSNFKRFWNYNNYYYTYRAHWKKFFYYPTVCASSAYGYQIYSLGFESMSCFVPLISPIDSSVDPIHFGYPILSSPTINNNQFLPNFFFIRFFQGFIIRFVKFYRRMKLRPHLARKKKRKGSQKNFIKN